MDQNDEMNLFLFAIRCFQKKNLVSLEQGLWATTKNAQGLDRILRATGLRHVSLSKIAPATPALK